MAKYEIDVPDDLLPEGIVPVAYRAPSVGELIHADNCVTTAMTGHVYPRLILSAKTETPAKTARPYNPEEMRNLYLGRARLVSGSHSHDVTGHDAKRATVRVEGIDWNAVDLRETWTHLDGTRCEVVE